MQTAGTFLASREGPNGQEKGLLRQWQKGSYDYAESKLISDATQRISELLLKIALRTAPDVVSMREGLNELRLDEVPWARVMTHAAEVPSAGGRACVSVAPPGAVPGLMLAFPVPVPVPIISSLMLPLPCWLPWLQNNTLMLYKQGRL